MTPQQLRLHGHLSSYLRSAEQMACFTLAKVVPESRVLQSSILFLRTCCHTGSMLSTLIRSFRTLLSAEVAGRSLMLSYTKDHGDPFCCAQVPTNTSLLVTLSPATGQANASFAQLTAIVFALSNGTALVPSAGSVSFSRDGASFGSARLTPVNSSSTPGTYAGRLPFAMIVTSPGIA